jgi:hypothetical protein
MGSVAIPSGGGSKITLVGTYNNGTNGTASIDIRSKLPNYANYTKDNFMVVPKQIYGHHSANVGGNWTRDFTPSISKYSNGVLTIANAGLSGGVTEGNYQMRVSSFYVYLIE